MTNVLSVVDRLPRAVVDADVRAVVMDILAQVEAGGVRGVAIVATTEDGSTLTAHSRADDVHLLVSGLARLQHRILAETEPAK